MVTMRAVRARLGQSLALFAMGVAVVAGCVVAVGYSRVTSGTVGAAGPLLLLGVVALAGVGAASARARRFEIALAQLRGRYGVRLLRAAVTEPVLILVVATLAGTAVGWLVTRTAVHAWADETATFEMTSTEWSTVAAVLVVSILVVIAVSWRTTYQPLPDKLSGVARPVPASAVGTFLSLLVLLGAAVSVYQARSHGVRHADWVSFLSPALLGLAAGQIGVWLLALLARAATGVTSLNRSIGWFVTLRRLTRVADTANVVRIVVAAVAVAGVAGSAWVGADSWRDSTARMRAGGAITYVVPNGGLQAYAASHQADPHGRWLMAMSAAPALSSGSYRDVFVDTPRWGRVVGSFFAGTPLASVSAQVAHVPAERAATARGNAISVTFTAASVQQNVPSARAVRRIQRHQQSVGYPFVPLAFRISYVDSSGDLQTQFVPRHADIRPSPVRPGVVGYSVPIHVAGRSGPPCALACTVSTVEVQGRTSPGAVRVTGMSFGDLQLLPLLGDGVLHGSYSAGRAQRTPGGLDLTLRDPYSTHRLPWRSHEGPSSALVTPDVKLERSGGKPIVYGLDGEPRAVDVSGEVPALPLLGRNGVLLDLGGALQRAGSQIPGSRALVAARADTPEAVLATLKATGAVSRQHLVGETLATIRRSGTAQGTLLYTLIAAFGLLIAALSVVAAVAEQRTERRREAAALRVVGVTSDTVTAGYRGEAGVLGVAVLVVGGIAVWVGCRALLGVLPLVDPGQFGLPFEVAPRLGLIAVVAGAAALLVALGVFVGFRLVGRSSPPSLLREEG
jgi:putative ABC transport system permease protein